MIGLIAGVALVNLAFTQGGSRTITGTLVDSAHHRPVSQVDIYLGRFATGQHSSNDGTFRVSTGEAAVVLMARRRGYVPALLPIPAGTAGTALNLDTTRLRQVKTEADRAAVEAADVAVYPELGQFYAHKARYRLGEFLTPDEMQQASGSVFTIIRRMPGFHFICFTTQKGEWDCGQESHRGRTSIMDANPTSPEQQPCGLQVWTNRVGPPRTLDEFQTDEVLAVEAYPNAAATPQEYAGSPCATVMLWMKQPGS